MRKDPRVCVEANLYYKTVPNGNDGPTAKYESVIGWGKAVLITDRTEKVNALKNMLDRYKQSGFPVTSCTGLPNVEVFAVRLDTVTGKHNL